MLFGATEREGGKNESLSFLLSLFFTEYYSFSFTSMCVHLLLFALLWNLSPQECRSRKRILLSIHFVKVFYWPQTAMAKANF